MSLLYRINLYGAFDILNRQGVSCAPKGKKGRALLALLATAPGRKRNRSWLKALLWGDVDEARASASLRGCLYDLRRHFEATGAMFDCDPQDVWLDPSTVAVDNAGIDGLQLLEGMDIEEEAFEDWLREQRSAVERRPPPSAARTDPALAAMMAEPFASPARPVLAVLPVVAATDATRTDCDAVADVIVKTIVEQECVDVFDLRCIHTQSFEPGHWALGLGLRLSLFSAGEERHLCVTLVTLPSGRVVWSRWHRAAAPLGAEPMEDDLLSTASDIANAIHDRIDAHCRPSLDVGMFCAVHNVLSHSRTGQEAARPWLAEAAEDSGVARAWLMYTYAVAHAERYGGLDFGSLEELDAHCIRADHAEPANPVVQAICGHIRAFVFRDFAQAEHHHAVARSLGWNQPVVWTLSAMHANYTDRPELAYRYSSRAIRQSQFNPHRFYFEGPHSISCTLTNRHAEAIQVSRRILRQRPGFLAVMRHLAASQTLSGRLGDARETIEQIRAKDPRFLLGEISAQDYPLPSATSVHVIEKALATTGMARSPMQI